MNKNAKIFVAGHRGLVGSAILKKLDLEGYANIITRTHNELDLTNQGAVDDFVGGERPEYIFLAAAKVGGIWANSHYPAEFIYQNTLIGFNVVHSAYKYGVKKLLNLGSSCIYPRDAPQPLKEEYLLSGPLESTNDAYAVSKIAVIKLCGAYNKQYGTNYISVMPSNLYGPGDNYDLETSHVLPAMIRKFHEAKISGTDAVTLWGDGTPFREFLYSDDLADAAVFLMQNFDAPELGALINIGSGTDTTVANLGSLIAEIVYSDAGGRKCRIQWDHSMPNGTMRKLLDVSKIRALGWEAPTSLGEGIKKAYMSFLRQNQLSGS